MDQRQAGHSIRLIGLFTPSLLGYAYPLAGYYLPLVIFAACGEVTIKHL